MRIVRPLLGAFGTALIVVGCGDEPFTPQAAPSFQISDGAHEGDDHFFFLPPLVPEPTTGGTFEPSFLPYLVVEVCELVGESCAVPALAEFTSTSGPGSETLRLNETDEHYIVNWHTDQFAIDENKTYRLQVRAREVVFGFADVDVVVGGQSLKNVDTGQFVGLQEGRTLPIRFRLETGVRGASVVGAAGGELTSGDGLVTMSFPPGAIGERRLFTLAPTTSVPPGPVVVGTVYEAGPDGTIFSEPVDLTLSYRGQPLPDGIRRDDVFLLTASDGIWEPVSLPHTGFHDVLNETLSGKLTHLSHIAAGAAPLGEAIIGYPWLAENEFWVPTSYNWHWPRCEGEGTCWQSAVDFYLADDQQPGTYDYRPFTSEQGEPAPSAGRTVVAAHDGRVSIREARIRVGYELDECDVSWAIQEVGAGNYLRYRYVAVVSETLATYYIHVQVDPWLEDGQLVRGGDAIGTVADPEEDEDRIGPDGISALGCARTAHLMFVALSGGAPIPLDDPGRLKLGTDAVFDGPAQLNPPHTRYVFGAMPRTGWYSEDFEGTSIPFGWQVIGGSWTVAGGKLVGSGTTQGGWGDFIVRTNAEVPTTIRARILNTPGLPWGAAGVIVNRTPSNDGTSIAIRTANPNSSASVTRVQNGVEETLASCPGGLVQASTWYRLEVGDTPNGLIARVLNDVTGNPICVMQVRDSGLTSSELGLHAFWAGGGTHVDWIETSPDPVVPPTFAPGDRIELSVYANVRSQPNPQAAYLRTMGPGARGTITGVMVRAGDEDWWEVDWSFLEGVDGSSPPFAPGEVVVAVADFLMSDPNRDPQTQQERLTVRAQPSVSSGILGEQSRGRTGTVLQGPVTADGFIWWEIDWSEGPDGWVIEDNGVDGWSRGSLLANN